MDANRASCILLDAIQPFGGAFLPRPFRSKEELAGWTRQESEARRDIDAIVREWLSHFRWRAGLHGLHADLSTMRFALALDWLGVPTNGEWKFEVRLEPLLIDCWPTMLYHWTQQQELIVESYKRGGKDGFRSFSE